MIVSIELRKWMDALISSFPKSMTDGLTDRQMGGRKDTWT